MEVIPWKTNIKNPKMEVWKMMFLVQLDDFQVPAVNFPGCRNAIHRSYNLYQFSAYMNACSFRWKTLPPSAGNNRGPPQSQSMIFDSKKKENFGYFPRVILVV